MAYAETFILNELTRVIIGAHMHVPLPNLKPQLVHHAHLYAHFVMRFFQATVTREAIVRIPEKFDAKIDVNGLDVALVVIVSSKLY